MKIGLLGNTGHWHSYAGTLKVIAGAEVCAVCRTGPDEALAPFDAAPGVTATTPRFETALELLERCRPDVVQICARPDRLAELSALCLERGVAVFCEKPLAMTLPALEQLYAVARRTGTPIVPMHMMRGVPKFMAVRAAIASGAIGTPHVAFSQKSYRWGNARPDYFRTRATFPGIAPFVGIHAIDWLYWMIGDVFTNVHGSVCAGRADFPGCATHGSFLFTLKSGGSAVMTFDYLRPDAAPTHGDDRVRVAGELGVVEARVADGTATLITAKASAPLPLEAPGDLFVDFIRAIQAKSALPISLYDGFRTTEIALRAQESADNSRTLPLLSSFDKK